VTRLAELEFDQHGDVQVARLGGELDLSNAADVSDALAAAVPADARGLVIDMTALTHIDSSGVRLLFGLRTRLAAQRQRLAIVVPGDAAIREVLELAAVGEAIPIYGSLEGAVLAMLGG
jgi:anti-anti-sigma factor